MTRHPRVPLAWLLGASSGALVGAVWDISRSPPHDSALSLPHLIVSLCAFAAAAATWAHARADGWWVARIGLGGALLMIAAGPLDLWWWSVSEPASHLLNPPHVVLAGGLLALQASSWLVTARGQSAEGARAALAYPFATGLLLATLAILATEYVARPNLWRGSQTYQIAGALFPCILVAIACSPRLRWGATTAAAVYLLTTLLVTWMVQLAPIPAPAGPASPGWVAPPPVPLLLAAPAPAIDLMVRRLGRATTARANLATGVLIGLVFTATLAATQWWLGGLLLSRSAVDVWFPDDRWPHAGPVEWRYQFWTLEVGLRPLARGMTLAAALASLSATAGLWLGRRVARLK